MNAHFTRTKTAAAVSALMACVALPPVSAVELAANGLGDAAVAPYYTVRSGQQTSFSIVNTSDTFVVAVKIRFHQATDSADIRDFDLFLSPNDVWTATIGADPTGLPYIRTTDQSCTVPTVLPAGTVNNPANRQIGFVPIGPNPSGLPQYQLDFLAGTDPDSRDGYIEILEMGVALPLSATNPSASLLASYAVKQNTSTGTVTVNGNVLKQDCGKLAAVYPPTSQPISITGSASNTANAQTFRVNCALDLQGTTALASLFAIGTSHGGVDAFKAEFCEPLDVLKVASSIVRVGTGVVIDEPVTTFANFASPGYALETPPRANYVVVAPGSERQDQPNAADLMSWEPKNQQPDFSNGLPGGNYWQYSAVGTQVSKVLAVDPHNALSRQIFNGTVYDVAFPLGASVSLNLATVNAVGSLIAAEGVVNEWWALVNMAPQTGWVVTFPTKRFYQQVGYSTGPFATDCPGVSMTYWDREEKQTIGTPLPSPGTGKVFCMESQTLTWRSGNYFGAAPESANTQPLQVGFPSGWGTLDFTDAGIISAISPAGATPTGTYAFFGLPAIGFASTTLQNGAVLTSYSTPHAFEREITFTAN